MRLTCPNCDAQYEVPDEVVPTSGRDVQCSNCGQTWFQHHPDHAPAEEEEAPLGVNTPAPDEETSPPPPPPPVHEPQRKQLDPAVADVLRQEAEVEFEARKRRQSAPLESQPDLGLDTADHRPPAPAFEEDSGRRAQDAKNRMARMRGEPKGASEAVATVAAISSRRELLPNIEEINSTLRNHQGTGGVHAEAREELGAGGAKKKKRGFKRGFLTVLIIAVILLLIYIYAAQIAQAMPALDGALTGYVAWMDQLRVALDGQIKALLIWLDSVALRSAS